MEVNMNFQKLLTTTLLAGILVSLPLFGAEKSKQSKVEKTSSSYKQLNDSNFDSVVQKGIVIVDFYGDRCPPCQKFGPIFEKVAGEMSDKGTFAKANIDQTSKAASKYNVSTIPTLIIFKDGKEIKRRTGSCDASTLKSFVRSAVK